MKRIDEVLGVDHALGKVVEVLGDRQVIQHGLRRRARKGRDPIDHPEHQKEREGDHPRDDLIAGEAGHEQPERQEAAAHEQQSEIARHHGPPFRVAERKQESEVNHGHRDHDGIEREAAQEFADDDLQVRERRRQQQLDRA
jgi:hypothetical protein